MIRQVLTLTLIVVAAPAPGEGLEPMADEALAQERIQVKEVRSAQADAAHEIQEIERQQRLLPDPPLAPEPGADPPPPPAPLLPYQERFLNSIIDAAQQADPSRY